MPRKSHKNKVYSAELKLQAVHDYLAHKGSQRELCRKYGIEHHSILQQWISCYNGHKDYKERPGMIGRLYIPAVNIDVAVFSSKAQETCDEDDSGCMFKQNNMILIVDHYYQEFKTLGECYVGCLAYIVTPENINPYICSANFTGTNMRDDIFDENWESVTIHYPGSIICYTCMDEYLNIRMVNFEFFPSKVFQ